MKRYIFIILTLSILFTACSFRKNTNDKRESIVIKAEENLSEDFTEYTVYDECEFDLNSDKNVEKIILYTDAKTDKDGLIENDSNKWVLVVCDNVNEKYYILFNDYIRHGNIRFQLADYLNKDKVTPSILIYQSSSAKIEITKFSMNESYDFVGEKLYNSSVESENGINLKYSSK